MNIKDILDNLKNNSHDSHSDYDFAGFNFDGVEIDRFVYVPDFYIILVKGIDGNLYIYSCDSYGDGFRYKWNWTEEDFKHIKDFFINIESEDIFPILLIELLETLNIRKVYNLK